MSQFICPLCGKFSSVRYYDPRLFSDEIMLVQVRGLGKGKGVEIVERYDLLEGENPELLDLISDRVEVLYNILYEDDDEPEEEEDIDELDITEGWEDEEEDEDENPEETDEFGFTSDDWEEI